MPIRSLPPLVVNQIAAGEVIERPASVVKELVENSIDAAATRIDVVIEQGGRELIQVTDDGAGIRFDELELALSPHATSKITGAEDLDAIATMGFRGEALASIASVSRVSLTSRPPGQDGGGVIAAEGDLFDTPRPAAAPIGSSVIVRNLFFNTPARRKFLRTERTEASRITDVVTALALAHSGIGFTLRHRDRLVLELSPGQDPIRRVIELLGRELEPELLELRADDRGITLWGMIGRPAIARGTSRHLRVFLNGRVINDRTINHAIKEAYRGLIDPSRFPTVVLFMEMDAAQVDVNVHPAKAEVRFRNQGQIHGAVLTAVRSRLREADLTPALLLQSESGRELQAIPMQSTPMFGSGLSVPAEATPESATSAFVDYFRRLDPKQRGFVYSEMREALADDQPDLPDASLEPKPSRVDPDDSIGDLPGVRAVQDILQVHSTFLVTQDEQGILIIDQHALHERVMFEKLKARITSGSLESQRLLMPATIDVSPSQMEVLDELQPMLMKIGIEAEPIGPAAIAVHAFSSFLFERKVYPVSFMRELLERAVNQGLSTESEAALHEVLDMMACKAAIKAGDRLSPDELTELMQHREAVDRASSCPHGRPTTLRLSIRDLEKQFGRR